MKPTMRIFYYYITVCIIVLHSNYVYATPNINKIHLKNPQADGFTYSSISRHEQRFWNNTQFLYEKSYHKTGAGNLDCVYDAVSTLPYNASFYKFHLQSDIKIVTNLKNRPDNVGLVLLGQNLSNQATLLPSGGDTSPALFLSSLIKKMCPRVLVQTYYNNPNKYTKTAYFDYVLFQYEK
jgi:hypothetical protein